MINTVALSDKSVSMLNLRSLSTAEINRFENMLNDAKQEKDASNTSSIEVLKSMSHSELALLQKAHSLADPIQVAGLSEEGATNLLAQPDYSNSVDLNNDGLVEVGAAKSMVFPPVNAPDFVQKAWDEATNDLSVEDKMILEFRMHISIYGINLGQTQNSEPQLSPQQQWQPKGIKSLFTQLRSNLEFRVNLDGWTKHNLMLKDVYNKFEDALAKHAPNSFNAPQLANNMNAANNANASNDKNSNDKNSNDKKSSETNDTASVSENTKTLHSMVLDARIGIDRAKLDEIEQKMKAIENDETLSPEEKQDMLEQLQKEKDEYLKQTAERLVEKEKAAALAG